MKNIDLAQFHWINKPNRFEKTQDILTIYTDPETDFWQRTYYGFRHDNAHAFVFPIMEQEFTFTVKTNWKPIKLFDQCGVVLYQDADNWFKASVEYENDQFSRLGSVVTNLGYSDWATTDIDTKTQTMWYRLSRRQQDFLIENSEDGQQFRQMRIFHLHLPAEKVKVGVYACSPLNSTFQARFSDLTLQDCLWPLHEDPEVS